MGLTFGFLTEALSSIWSSHPWGFALFVLLAIVSAIVNKYVYNPTNQILIIVSASLIGMLILSAVGFASGVDQKLTIVQKDDNFHRLDDGTKVQLLDVRSLRGWGEGRATESRKSVTKGIGEHVLHRDVPIEVYRRIVSELRTEMSAEDIKKMSQKEWEEFVISLSSSDRLVLGNTSWAVLSVSRGGRDGETVHIFRGMSFEGNIKGKKYTMKHIFNIHDRVSSDRETVIFQPEG